jgi:hypothetical protein
LPPKPEILERWELDETWLVVSPTPCGRSPPLAPNVRAGETAVGSLVIFQAAEVREASAEKRKQLQETRKADRDAAKQQSEREAQTAQSA